MIPDHYAYIDSASYDELKNVGPMFIKFAQMQSVFDFLSSPVLSIPCPFSASLAFGWYFRQFLANIVMFLISNLLKIECMQCARKIPYMWFLHDLSS